MVNEQLLDYVKNELAKGISEDKLRHVLMDNGWPEFEINEAFEKVKEAKVEKPSEEAKPVEQKPKVEEAKPKEKPFKEFLEGLSEKEPEVKEEAKPEEKVEKPPVMDDVKKIVTNKIFIIAAVVIVLGSIAFFVLPPFLEGGEEVEMEGFSSGAADHAKKMCRQYCDSNQCGLFIDNTVFTHPELEGQSCVDLGFSCLQPNGDPKCETAY